MNSGLHFSLLRETSFILKLFTILFYIIIIIIYLFNYCFLVLFEMICLIVFVLSVHRMEPHMYFDTQPIHHLHSQLSDHDSGNATYTVDYLLTFDSYLDVLNDTIRAHSFAQNVNS